MTDDEIELRALKMLANKVGLCVRTESGGSVGPISKRELQCIERLLLDEVDRLEERFAPAEGVECADWKTLAAGG